MKKIALIALAWLCVSPVFADTCRMETPISVGNESLLNQGLVLKEVEFDQVPQWNDPSAYDAAKDKIVLDLFNIRYGSTFTGYLGSNAEIVGKLESIGFSKDYTGSFNISGSSSTSNGKTVYTTQKVDRYTEPQHAKNDAITETTVTVENGQLVSVVMTIPVFKVWKVEDGAEYLAFTGNHQTLCLKSAK